MASKSVATLLERERELAELHTVLREAQDDRGQIVLIEAPAGLGKTSLLWATFDTAASMGFASLRTRASELEHDFPYGCVRRLLEPMIGGAAGAERDRLFEDAAALALPLFAAGSVVTAQNAGNGAFAMLHGLYWLLNNLARDRPVALFVDDLQWSDVESLRFLSYLESRLDGLPVAVFATVRSRENVTTDLARLSAQPAVRVLRIEPLSVEAAATLCELELGTTVDHDFAVACHGATGGNPFFLQTLLREAKELRFLTNASEAARVRRIGPAAVARAVLLRLSAAPAAATTLVRAIAVLGDAASVVDAARLADLSEDEAARVADLLAGLGILKATDGLEFAHPIVRHAIYDDIGNHERARAHARAARILAERGADDERIAAQIVKSEPMGDPTRVVLLRRIATRALAQGAPAAALAWLKRALAEPPPLASRPEVLLELGSAELRLGMPDALSHLKEAATELRNPLLLTIAAQQLANAMSMSGDPDSAVASLASAVAVVEPQDRERALILEAELAAKAQQTGPETRAKIAARLARYQGLTGDSPGERLVLASLAFESARASESESEAVKHIARGLAGGSLFRQQPDVVGPFYALVVSLLATDALELAHTSMEQALIDARARGSIPAMAFLIVHRGWCYVRSGDLVLAEADARTALDLMTAHDIRLGARLALALLVEALMEAGQVAQAEEVLGASALAAEIPLTLASNHLLEVRGRLRIARGNPRPGLDDLVEFGRRDQLLGAANPIASRWRSTACLALRELGDAEGARQMAAEEVVRARRWGAASGLGIALRALALNEGGAAAIDLLAEAVGVLERSPAKLEYARALTDLGAAQRRANRRAEARSTLEQGLKLARLCQAGALAERADVELRAAGGRSSDPSGNRLQQLTVSERRVAELAAKGHSNPQIAQALFVTRKTIETHLGRIYSKLEISGRAALAGALADESREALG